MLSGKINRISVNWSLKLKMSLGNYFSVLLLRPRQTLGSGNDRYCDTLGLEDILNNSHHFGILRAFFHLFKSSPQSQWIPTGAAPHNKKTNTALFVLIFTWISHCSNWKRTSISNVTSTSDVNTNKTLPFTLVMTFCI